LEGAAADDREKLADLGTRFLRCRIDAEVVNRPGVEFAIARSWLDFEGDGIVFVVAAIAEATLEVAGGTRFCIEDRAETVAMGQRIIRRPLVLEKFAAG